MIKKLKERLLDIVSHSILDGQNQIHDLRDEKATPKDIDKRMFKSLEFHSTAINKVILEVLEEIDDKVNKIKNADGYPYPGGAETICKKVCYTQYSSNGKYYCKACKPKEKIKPRYRTETQGF